ncbi:helix-turn-helix domain-containing protein [Neptuniibacter marinus]|uniref:helix-turn-helix domain-containing protein n=1 Tax=Neptuniibacter marinus TaxID=1806670 RepID=UPI003B59A54B
MAKYSRAFKIAAVKQYLNGTSSLSLGAELNVPASLIRYWTQVYRFHGETAFQPPISPYCAQDKLRMLNKMWAEQWSLGYTSAYYNLVSPGTLYVWQRRYRSSGIKGLEPSKRGKTFMTQQSSPPQSSKISEMTPEEMQKELEYLRAENAVLKKLDALYLKKQSQTKRKR